MNRFRGLLSICLLFLTAHVQAAMIELVPPSTPLSSYSGALPSLGILFNIENGAGTKTISSVGTYVNGDGVTLSYELGFASSSTILSSGSQLVSGSGAQWVDFAVANVDLDFLLSDTYRLEFFMAGTPAQTFYYSPVVGYSQDDFFVLGGVYGGSASGTIRSTARLTEGAVAASVPTPGALLLVIGGLASLRISRQAKCRI